MIHILWFLFLFFISGCGIDKEGAPPASSVLSQGELDLSYYDRGFNILNNAAGGNGDDQISQLVQDSNGRLIAVGSSINSSGNLDLAVWRFSEDGVLDSSFSGDGVFTHNNAAGGSGDDAGMSAVVTTNGTIYVTGYSTNGIGNRDMVVWKIKSNGQLDTTFSGTGYLVHNGAAGGNLEDVGQKIAAVTGGVIVVGYSDQAPGNRDLAVWKVLSNGTLDTTFSGVGFTTHDGAGGGVQEWGNDLAIDLSGNIFVVGQAETAGFSYDMALWKFSRLGVLDTTFKGQGWITHNNAAGGSGIDTGIAMIRNDEGSLFITGYSRNNRGDNDMVLWKYHPNGDLDTSFNGVGFTVFDVASIYGGSSNDMGQSLIIDNEGKIVVAGNGYSDLCIWRYNPDGQLDEDFNVDGFFSHDSAAGGFGFDTGATVIQDSLNRIYVGGSSTNNSGNLDAVLWRFQ